MGSTFALGRLAGIRIGVNWSVLVIFALLAWSLAAVRFPAAYPEFGTAAHVTAALVTAVVFFASLLVHEMAHALVARRNDVRVEGITLWLFGGVARLSGDARSPGAELRISGVGPLVSVLLGGVFLGAAVLLAATGYSGLVLGALGWLGFINLVLAAFNSIPAAPLDGGRLLRSLIWWRTGDPVRATRYASRAGQVFGWILVGVGLFSVLGRGDFGALWIVLIGWFILGAATAELREAGRSDRLGGLAVRDVMTPDPVTAPAGLTVDEMLRSEVIRHRHSTFPITEDGGPPVGLLTFNQIRAVPPEARAMTRLRDIACPMAEVTLARPDEPAGEVLSRLSECAGGRTLVVADGRLLGIVSPSDVSRALRWADVRRGAR